MNIVIFSTDYYAYTYISILETNVYNYRYIYNLTITINTPKPSISNLLSP